jgi:sulfatase maturation enzyme AslB (radical SAM superfamily)
MTKPRLVKVEALFYVFQQLMQRGRAMNFDTPSTDACNLNCKYCGYSDFYF